MFVKPDLFFVVDTLLPSGDDDHTYQARWHFKEPNVHVQESTRTAVSTDEDVPNLAIIPLLQKGLSVEAISAQEEPELMGWWILKKVDIKALPAATVCHTLTGRGIQHMAALLMPLKPGTADPIVEVTESEAGT